MVAGLRGGLVKINSVRKGKVNERKAAAYLRSLGFHDAERTQQHEGAGSNGDVWCPQTLPRLHIEVKSARAVRLGTAALDAACEQAGRDAAAGKNWCVLWLEARRGWRLTWSQGIEDGVTLTTTGDRDIERVLRQGGGAL